MINKSKIKSKNFKYNFEIQKNYLITTLLFAILLVVGIILVVSFFTYGNKTTIYLYIGVPLIVNSLLSFLFIYYKSRINQGEPPANILKSPAFLGYTALVLVITAGLIYGMYFFSKFCPPLQTYDKVTNKCTTPGPSGGKLYSCKKGACVEDPDGEDLKTCQSKCIAPGVKYYCSNDMCQEVPSGILCKEDKNCDNGSYNGFCCFNSQKDCLDHAENVGCCPSGQKSYNFEHCDTPFCCPDDGKHAACKSPVCQCVVKTEPSACIGPVVDDDGTIESMGSYFVNGDCGGCVDYTSEDKVCQLITKTKEGNKPPCLSGKFAGYKDGVCVCGVECDTIPYCQLLDDTGTKCLYPPHFLNDTPNSILTEVNQDIDTCEPPSLSTIETACKNCASGTPSDHCSTDPKLVWENGTCYDQTGTANITLSLDDKSLLTTQQISGTLHYTGTVSSDMKYIYTLNNGTENYVGYVYFYDIGTDCGTDNICEKFVIMFDSQNPPAEGNYNLSISAMSDSYPSTTGPYYAEYTTIKPQSLALEPPTTTGTFYPSLIPQLDKNIATNVATKYGKKIISTLPERLPIYDDSNLSGYVVCPALSSYDVTSGAMIVIIGWDTVSIPETLTTTCKLTNPQVYYYVERSQSALGLNWSSWADPKSENWVADVTAKVIDSPYIYRIGAFLSDSQPTGSSAYDNATCKAPFVYVNVSLPSYDYKLCRSIPASYDKNAPTTTLPIPPFLVPTATQTACHWSTISDISAADSYCMLEDGNRQDPKNKDQPCDNNCNPGEYDAKNISLYDKSTSTCKKLEKGIPSIKGTQWDASCGFDTTNDSNSNLKQGVAEQCNYGIGPNDPTHQNQWSRTLQCPQKLTLGSSSLLPTGTGEFSGRIDNVKTYLTNVNEDAAFPPNWKLTDGVTTYETPSVDPNLTKPETWSKNFICCPFNDTDTGIQACGTSTDNMSTWAMSQCGCDSSDSSCTPSDWDAPGGIGSICNTTMNNAKCYQDASSSPTQPSTDDCSDCSDYYNACSAWTKANTCDDGNTCWEQKRNCWNIDPTLTAPTVNGRVNLDINSNVENAFCCNDAGGCKCNGANNCSVVSYNPNETAGYCIFNRGIYNDNKNQIDSGQYASCT